MDINCQVLVALQYNAMIPAPVDRLLFPFLHIKLLSGFVHLLREREVYFSVAIYWNRNTKEYYESF